MSRHYDEVWRLIEALDDISGQLSDILDDERDHAAWPHLHAAIKRIDDAVAELENVDPDDHGDGTPLTGSIVIGRSI